MGAIEVYGWISGTLIPERIPNVDRLASTRGRAGKCEHSVHTRRAGVQPGRALPRALDRALGALEIACINSVKRTATVLSELGGYLKEVDDTTMEVEIKKLVKRLEQGATGAQRIDTHKMRSPVAWMQEDPLDWCIYELAKSPDDAKGFDHAMLFKFLEDHLTPGGINRLEPVIMRQLSDLAALHELLMAVRMHRPRNTNQTTEAFTGTENRSIWNLLQTKGNPSEHQHTTKRTEAATQTLYDCFCRLNSSTPRENSRFVGVNRCVQHLRRIVPLGRNVWRLSSEVLLYPSSREQTS